MTNRERGELHRRWWRRENEVPLVNVFRPSKSASARTVDPYGRFDLDVPPDRILARKWQGESSADRLTDKLQVRGVDFGVPFLPALAGAQIEYDGQECWCRPCASSVRELRVGAFDEAHPLWQRYVRLLEELLAHWSWDTYLPAGPSMLGPMDTLSLMLGPDNLIIEMHEHPDEVLKRAGEAAELFLEVHRRHMDLFRSAGLTEGCTDWMKIWFDGMGSCYSEDFSALVSDTLFADFFRPANEPILRELDMSMMHIHSGAWRCVGEVIAQPGLDAMELSNDPSGPDLETLIELGRSVQRAGKPLQVSNWERPLTTAEIERILDSLQPQGLILTLQARTPGEVQELYALARQRR